MNCSGCGNPAAWALHIKYSGGITEEFCDRCGNCRGSAIPDVYWPGTHSIEHVIDGSGKPIEFTSKAHKARVFKEQGLREAGDRVHGSRSLPLHSHPRYQRPTDPSAAKAS